MKFVKVLKAGIPTKEELTASTYNLSSKILAFNNAQNDEMKSKNEDTITKILEHIDQIAILVYNLK